MFNPMIVAELFKEQSSPWTNIAEEHVQKVWKAVRLSLKHLLTYVADATAVNAISEVIFEPGLNSLLKILREKLSVLLRPHQSGHPITYNHYFTETLQKIRTERQTLRFTDIITRVFDQVPSDTTCRLNQPVNLGKLIKQLVDQPERDMDHFAASEALDCLNAYYKVKIFIRGSELRIAADLSHSRLLRNDLSMMSQ